MTNLDRFRNRNLRLGDPTRPVPDPAHLRGRPCGGILRASRPVTALANRREEVSPAGGARAVSGTSDYAAERLHRALQASRERFRPTP